MLKSKKRLPTFSHKLVPLELVPKLDLILIAKLHLFVKVVAFDPVMANLDLPCQLSDIDDDLFTFFLEDAGGPSEVVGLPATLCHSILRIEPF